MDLNDKQDVRRNRIRFVLDGEIVSAEVTDPTRTILQYLREDLRRTGTKEGCAEGDCGACTVVIGEPGHTGRLQLRAVNSCIQFLPTLNGKLLFTVESLSEPGGLLHPVQQAMVDCHASQCGFCTPGFVMSLFALYKTRREPDRREIDDSLAADLCRCTGYRPIIEAARSMYDYEGDGERSWIRRRQAIFFPFDHHRTVCTGLALPQCTAACRRHRHRSAGDEAAARTGHRHLPGERPGSRHDRRRHRPHRNRRHGHANRCHEGDLRAIPGTRGIVHPVCIASDSQCGHGGRKCRQRLADRRFDAGANRAGCECRSAPR